MATNNQNLPVRIYAPQYIKMLEAVFGVKKAFAGALAPLQTRDGVSFNAKAFSVKTCNTPVTVGTYSTTGTVQFGTGTGSGSRFGNRVEIIYTDTDVPYDYTLAIHEGLDRFTVNNGLDAAVADRLRLHTEAETRTMNTKHGAFMSANAGKTETLASYTDAPILALFDKMSSYYTNLEVTVPVTAYVVPDLFNAIVNQALATSSKGSTVNIDRNTINDFKGFKIVKEPEKYFSVNTQGKTKDIAYFAADGILLPFVGVTTARTIEAEEFDGVALQVAARGGTFILDDNKAALGKVTMTTA